MMAVGAVSDLAKHLTAVSFVRVFGKTGGRSCGRGTGDPSAKAAGQLSRGLGRPQFAGDSSCAVDPISHRRSPLGAEHREATSHFLYGSNTTQRIPYFFDELPVFPRASPVVTHDWTGRSPPPLRR